MLYSKYAGTELRVGGEEHLILKAEDVVGTLAGDALAELKPYGDRILLRKAPLTQHTAGGVLLPGSTADGAPTGRVVAVGPGKLRDEEGGGRDPMPLSPGDAVLYTQYAGIELPGDKDSEAGYVVLRSEDIVVRLS